jgi:VIT1/CCC1 family predicted Fe2+/Mn2+ transporter
MDLTQIAPRSPYFYRTVSSIGVTAVGAMLLVIVALQFSDSTTGPDRLALGVITLGIAAIGLAYFKQRGVLNEMDGKISDEVVLRLRHTANAMACSGFMICIFALGLIHRH